MKVLTQHQLIKDLHIKAILKLYVISVNEEAMKNRCCMLFNIPKTSFERSLFSRSASFKLSLG